MKLRSKCILLFLLIRFVSYSQVAQKTVIATKSDGIYSILRKNNLDPAIYFKTFIALNKSNLGTNNHLIAGKTYILPINKEASVAEVISEKPKAIITDSLLIKPSDSISLVETKTHPILGKTNASVTIKDNTLNGAVYHLISGHGGPDPGAITRYNGHLISEDEYAYDVTLRLAKLLISNGAQVYIIIKDPDDGIRNQQILKVDYDEVNYPNKTISRYQKLRLKQRTQSVNMLYKKHIGNYQRLIVIHVDSRSESKNIDVFFYHHKNSKSGKRLAENIHNSFQQKYAKHQPNRIYSGTVGSRNLYVIKNTLPAMVYIELGNIKNKKDQKRILNYENREALAKWIHNGLLIDFQQNK